MADEPAADPNTPQPTQAHADTMKERVSPGGEAAPAEAAPAEAASSVAKAPVNRAVPVVSGNGVVGESVSCVTGDWDGEPTSYTYAWKAKRGTDEVNLPGKSDSYTVQSTDAGSEVFCVVSATNAGGTTVAPPSNRVVVPEVATGITAPTPDLTPKR